MMGFNIVNEYLSLGREVPLTRLPTVMSYTARLGVDDKILTEQASALEWGPFLRGQVSRVGGMSTPYFVDQRLRGAVARGIPGLLLVLGVCAAGVFFMRHRLVIAALLLSGWCWVIPMRTFAGTHVFEALVFIGTPLVLLASGFLLVRWLVRREWVVRVLAVGVLGVFVLSSFEMGRVGHGAESARFEEAVMRDFEVIRRLTPGEDVLLLLRGRDPRSQDDFAGAHHAASHYLAQRSRYLRMSRHTLTGDGGYVVMRNRIDTPALLTPENRGVFLYDLDGLMDVYRADYRSIRSGELVSQGDFDVYRRGGSLYFVKEPCEYQAGDLSFFLHIVPADENDLLDHRRQYGFNTLSFGLDSYSGRVAKFDDVCMTLVYLPEYEAARLMTGHIGGGSGVLTHDSSGFIDLYRAAHRRITEGEPVVRSRFDVYAGKGTLTYVRESCGPEDVGRKFFLHVFPADAGALSGQGAEVGYENRDFDFWWQGGLMFDGMCMVTVALPGYEVAGVYTGQFSESEGTVWSGEFGLGE